MTEIKKIENLIGIEEARRWNEWAPYIKNLCNLENLDLYISIEIKGQKRVLKIRF